MDHEQAQSLFSDYLEGGLAEEERHSLEEHLSGCQSCQTDFGLLRRSLQLVKELPKVSAPTDFSLRVKNRARKAGLLRSQRRKAALRQMVPFEATLVVLIAAVGALVVFLLYISSEIQTYLVEPRSPVIPVESSDELNRVAQDCWRVGGEVRSLGRIVPPLAPLGASQEIELVLTPESYTPFREGLSLKLPREQPAPSSDGKVHLLVQIRLGEPGRRP